DRAAERGEPAIAARVAGVPVRVDDQLNGLGRQRRDDRMDLVDQLGAQRVDDHDAFIARLNGHVPGRRVQHVDIALHVQEIDLGVLCDRRGSARRSHGNDERGPHSMKSGYIVAAPPATPWGGRSYVSAYSARFGFWPGK